MCLNSVDPPGGLRLDYSCRYWPSNAREYRNGNFVQISPPRHICVRLFADHVFREVHQIHLVSDQQLLQLTLLI